ncbi:hypothetical protein QI339_12195 [Staphylococcus saprophyticus]|nr:hypothetical protein [Staphylococcus saprophyticus]
MLKSVRDRTIHWLESNRNHGAFDNFDEDTMDFKSLDDESIEWYFINWWFTDDYLEMVPVDELECDFEDELNERQRVLNR